MKNTGVPSTFGDLHYLHPVYQTNKTDASHHDDVLEVRQKKVTLIGAIEDYTRVLDMLGSGIAGEFIPWNVDTEELLQLCKRRYSITKSRDERMMQERLEDQRKRFQ